MKRLLICCIGSLGMSLAGAYDGLAQHSLPSTQAQHIYNTHSVRTIAESYVALSHLEKPRLALTPSQRHYTAIFKDYLSAHKEADELGHQYQKYLDAGINRSRGALLLAIAYYEEGKRDDALALLNSLEYTAMFDYEQEQASLLRCYLLLSERKNSGSVQELATELTRLAKRKNLRADQASLYLSSIAWHQGDPQRAQKILEERQWNDELIPEVEYQGALLSYAIDSPSAALSNSQTLLNRYPEMRNRPRLIGQMGYAYYKLGDYPNASSTIKSISGDVELLPIEHYVLGAALYEQKQYTEAIPALQQANFGNADLKAIAQYALGNIFASTGDNTKAKLAFESVINQDSAAKAKLREGALYRFIEIAHSEGNDAFGSHAKYADSFLRDYPQSQHRGRVLEIIKAYISNSRDYSSSLRLIDALQAYGLDLQGLKQDTYLRQALAHKAQGQDYQADLNEAIKLGSKSSLSYPIALALRSEYYSSGGDYKLAERDARQALEHSRSDKELNAQSAYLLGYSLYNQKSYSEALASLRTASSGLGNVALRSDASLRLGDCLLALKRNGEAQTAYNEAHQLSPNGSDEALYRLATIAGKESKYSRQIQQLEQLLRDYPSTSYVTQALYDKGRAEYLSGQSSTALNTFEQLTTLYPSSSLAPTARLERAMIYSNLSQDDKAIENYKQLINTYPQSKEAETALADLKAIYIELGRADDYLAYTKSLGGQMMLSDDEEAHLRFLAIEERAKAKSTNTRAELEQYLEKYPKSTDAQKAQSKLAEYYHREGRSVEALRLLRAAFEESKQGEHKLQAGLNLAKLQLELGQEAEAHTSYQQVYQLAQGTHLFRTEAALGLLRTAVKAQNNKESLAVASELLKQTDLQPSVRLEATLLRGRIEESNKSFNTAIATYASIADAPNSVYGAEAIVRQADILYRLKRYKESQVVLDKFINSDSQQTYWLARAFVLLSDCYEQQGDRYLAKQYLESLRDNYTGKEVDIWQQIETRLSKYND